MPFKFLFYEGSRNAPAIFQLGDLVKNKLASINLMYPQ